MTITLHLGVVDFPYTQSPNAEEPVRQGKRRGGSRWRRRDLIGGEVATTGDVAEILEKKYNIMSIFVEEHMDDVILPAVQNALAGALETVLMGGPAVEGFALGSAASGIETAFKNFISNKEMESLGYPGVPTQAAQRGVNHRMLHPYKRRAARASFRDTGLYQSSFKVWGD